MHVESQEPANNGMAYAPEMLPEPERFVEGSQAALKVERLVAAFRSRGHLEAKISPLESVAVPLPETRELGLAFHGLTDSDLESRFPCAAFQGQSEMPLRDLLKELRRVYCGSIGIEFTHIHDQAQRQWLQERFEHRLLEQAALPKEEQTLILKRLIEAEVFESQLHKKYVGQKRFSLEGGGTLIPLLDEVVDNLHGNGVRELVIGMAHRGRLTVLTNTLGKPMQDIFTEFEDQSIFSSLGSGDVKYHLGHQGTCRDRYGNELQIALVPNPSHLEAVDPVVEGICRGKQDKLYNRDRHAVLPLLIHGDAAVIGQGIVPETVNMSAVSGYRTGGTLHVVVNNQIGFTTNPSAGRSSPYCTELIKAFQAPVFHVNAEDPEAACWAARVALEFRARFQRDVVVDLYCFRKYGHNEADDPSFTQPLMYSEIKQKPRVSEIYRDQLIAAGVIDEQVYPKLQSDYLAQFEHAFENRGGPRTGEACSLHGRLRVPAPDTGVELERLKHIASMLVNYPPDFHVHPKLGKILTKRVEDLNVGSKIDWAFAEALAFGSLVQDGVGVRLSGQDCGRGTFSQRHLVLSDYKTGAHFLPFEALTHETERDVRYEVYNSPLSEAGVMGFEFGYAHVARDSLVLWEAQFGDFSNGAQIIIDQFLSGSEAKWDQRSGLVLLLPHGYEGQGPEHSSARLERYLQLCAEGNMVVCMPSTASQYFHLLRRQGVLGIKRPLVVMTPKSLLRHSDAATHVDELTFGTFHTVLEDRSLNGDHGSGEDIRSLVFLAGKVCYDIRNGLKEQGIRSARIVRMEQLYPFPEVELRAVLEKYPQAEQFFWVQEEPQNMGAWPSMYHYFQEELEVDVQYIGRPAAASTATGSARWHAVEQRQIVEELVRYCR